MTSTASIDGVELREGDEAAIKRRYNSDEYLSARIKRITPSGQIVAMAENVEYRFKSDGWEKSGSYHPRLLVPITDEIRVKIEQSRLQVYRRRIYAYKWDAASDATIMDVARLLGLLPKE